MLAKAYIGPLILALKRDCPAKHELAQGAASIWCRRLALSGASIPARRTLWTEPAGAIATSIVSPYVTPTTFPEYLFGR